MADTKISALATATSLAATDLFAIIDDMATTPVSRSLRADALKTYIEDFGETPPYYAITSAETTAGVTPTNYEYEPGNVLRYGATGDGVTDDSGAFADWASVMTQQAGDYVIPPGDYNIGTQISIQFENTGATNIYGYGARIVSDSLADFPFNFFGTGQNCRRTVHGLHVSHWDNTTSTGAFEIANCQQLSFVDCSVRIPNNPASGYAAWYFHQSDSATTSTGTFWPKLIRCVTRGTTTPTTKAINVHVRGAVNVLELNGCDFHHGDPSIKHENETDVTGGYIGNAMLVTGCSFESYGTAYQLSSGNASTTGWFPRFIGNRFEGGTTIFELDAGSAPLSGAPAVPLFLSGNFLISNAGTYLVNSNNLAVNALDPSITPDGLVQLTNDSSTPALIKNLKASTHALAVQAQTGGYGLVVRTSDGTDRVELKTRSGGGGTLKFQGSLGDLVGINSVSGNSTTGQNLRGTATLASGTAAVTFGTAEPDASYYLALSGNAAETFTWASKATSGFTINSSNGSSTATVDWILIR